MRASATLNRGGGGRIYIGAFARGGPFGAPGDMHSVATRASGAVAPPSSGCCDKGTKNSKSALQLQAIPGHDSNGTACGADDAFCSWSIQSALQAAYPPVPLVTAFSCHRARLLSPQRLLRQADLLPVRPDLCTRSARVAASDAEGGGGSGDALQLLLGDVTTLPWGAGSHLTLALRNAAMHSGDEATWRGPLAAAGGKGDGGEASRLLNAAPVEARVGDGAVELPHINTAHSSLALSDAKHVDRSSADSSSTVSTAVGHAGKEAWKPFSEYSTPQACAETSALALRSFAVITLGQRVPLVALAAEKAFSASVAPFFLTEEGVTHRTSTVYAQQRSDTPAWLPPHKARYGMPVEVYAERTPLVLTGGTTALQKALGHALHRIAMVSDNHNSRNAARLSASFHPPPPPPAPASGRLRWSVSPLAHVIWNGQCWVEETDLQVAKMEERLLGALVGGRDDHATAVFPGAVRSAQNKNTITCSTPSTQSAARGNGGAGRLAGFWLGWSAQGTSYPRLWLPSFWSSADRRRGLSTPLFRDDDGAAAETGAVLDRTEWGAPSPVSRCRFVSNPYEAWKHPSEDAGVAEAAVEAPAAAPAALKGDTQTPGALCCSQWVLRLRKIWLLTGPNVQSSTLARAGAEARTGATAQADLGDADVKSTASLPAAARGASAHSRGPSLSSYAPISLSYPNYDLLTGLPLNLHDYNAAATMALGTASSSRTSPCASPASRSPRQSLWPSRTTQPPPACDPGVPQPQAVMPASKGGPFFFAALSQQVGWIRLCPTCSSHTLHVGASSASTPVATQAVGPVSWQLPDALRSCYKMPSSISDIPQRWLCSETTAEGQKAVPSTAVASSTATEPRLPVSPQPPVASVSVPRQEWWTGFFLHDAPHWWRRKVSESVHRRWAVKSISKDALATSAGPRDECVGESVTALEEVTQILSFLEEECRVPPPPVNASSTAAVVAWPRQGAPQPASDSCPPLELTPQMATLPPRLYVLQLAPIAPMLRRSHRSIRCDEEDELEENRMAASTTDAQRLELQWFLVPNTATVTVNTFFSLQNVMDHAGASGSAAAALPPAPSADYVALFYLEVKAALEILRRVTHAAAAWEDNVDDAEDPSPPPSSSSSPLPAWWERVSAFYDANTFLAKETAPSAAVLATDADEEADGGGGGEGVLGTTHAIAGSHEAFVSAFCHPTATEVVRACLRLMLQCGGPSQHRYASDSPITLGSGDTESKGASSEVLAVWSRRDYDVLLRTAASTATPSSTPYLCSENADGDGDRFGAHEEGEGRGAEELTPDHRDDGAAPTENESDSSRAVSARTQWRHSACISSCAVAPSSQDHAANVERGSPSSAQVAQRSSSTSSSLPYGVEVREYDEDGMRREVPVSPGGRTACLDGTQPLSNGLENWPRDHLWRTNRRNEALQTHKAPVSIGAVAAAAPAFTSCATAGGESLQAVPRGTTCGDPILEARKEGKHNGEDAGAGDVPPAPRQQSSALPPHPSDVIDALIAEEHDRFDLQWQPWLRYLPLPATSKEDTLPTSAPPTGPRTHVPRVFPFLKSSAASEYCTDCPFRTEISASDSGAKPKIDTAVPSAAATLSDGAVVVQDLGLCMLHIRHTELFVNAANLIYCEANHTQT